MTHIFMIPIPFLIIKEKVLEGCWKSKTGRIYTFNLFFNKTAEEEARLTHLIVTSLAGVICGWLTGIVVFIFLVVWARVIAAAPVWHTDHLAREHIAWWQPV